MTKTPQSDHEERSLRARCFETKPVESVTDLDYGRYLVVTASGSVYVLVVGPESSAVVRSSQCPTVGDWEAVPLRRDGETVPLLGIIELQLGRRALFRIDVRDDGIETTRTTTPVIAIRRLTK